MKYANKIILVVLLISTLACQLFSTSESTQSEQLKRSIPTNESFDLGTLQPLPPEETVSASAITDNNGVAEFDDPISGNNLTVEFQDEETQDAISGIEVWFISNGPQVLVITNDHSGQYATAVKELFYEELAILPTSSKLASPSESLSLGTVILLVKIINTYQTISEWHAYLSQFPELKKWRTGEISVCMNPVQLGEGANLITQGIVGILLPSFGDDILDGLMLVYDEALGEGIETWSEMIVKESNPVIHRVTLFSFNGDVPKLMHFDDRCLDWLDQSDPQSTLDWLMYGLENQDMYALTAITTSDDLIYANYLEGGQSISNQTYLKQLESRLSSKPSCEGYSTEINGIQVWTHGWSPLWQITEICYMECNSVNPPWESSSAGFFLNNYDGEWEIGLVYLNTPDRYLCADDYQLTPCSTLYSSISNDAPVLSSANQISSCPNAPLQQMKVNHTGYVCTKSDAVVVRGEPNRAGTFLTQLEKGTEFWVIGGPECADDWSWWKIETDNGIIGWIAEGGDQIDPYFICPVP